MHRPLRLSEINVQQIAETAEAQRKTPITKRKRTKPHFERELMAEQKAQWLQCQRERAEEMMLVTIEVNKLSHPDILQRKKLHEMWEGQWEKVQGGEMDLLDAVNARITLQGYKPVDRETWEAYLEPVEEMLCQVDSGMFTPEDLGLAAAEQTETEQVNKFYWRARPAGDGARARYATRFPQAILATFIAEEELQGPCAGVTDNYFGFTTRSLQARAQEDEYRPGTSAMLNYMSTIEANPFQAYELPIMVPYALPNSNVQPSHSSTCRYQQDDGLVSLLDRAKTAATVQLEQEILDEALSTNLTFPRPATQRLTTSEQRLGVVPLRADSVFELQPAFGQVERLLANLGPPLRSFNSARYGGLLLDQWTLPTSVTDITLQAIIDAGSTNNLPWLQGVTVTPVDNLAAVLPTSSTTTLAIGDQPTSSIHDLMLAWFMTLRDWWSANFPQLSLLDIAGQTSFFGPVAGSGPKIWRENAQRVGLDLGPFLDLVAFVDNHGGLLLDQWTLPASITEITIQAIVDAGSTSHLPCLQERSAQMRSWLQMAYVLLEALLKKIDSGTLDPEELGLQPTALEGDAPPTNKFYWRARPVDAATRVRFAEQFPQAILAAFIAEEDVNGLGVGATENYFGFATRSVRARAAEDERPSATSAMLNFICTVSGPRRLGVAPLRADAVFETTPAIGEIERFVVNLGPPLHSFNSARYGGLLTDQYIIDAEIEALSLTSILQSGAAEGQPWLQEIVDQLSSMEEGLADGHSAASAQ
ncbi:hypothetical protein IE81DRAFT_347700 [Ceraceosorus guamensis]|uniref:Uncharacterized protein n=1 Tax=Ceraceosorus guamensis TaxID=1522189 RepID=A0A316VXD6_9BASI|nr:hypothetical protein IE81DRAFT_347700 [Ceraceosorus guamensis]PWN42130.1 hypothetical protein IE81DRAFT_347700 [Ceraceosorus guamensis]